MVKQLSIDFNPNLSKCYGSLVEYLQARVYQQGLMQKQIAADMDLSPSHLNRKLAQSPNDSMKFTIDNLEQYIEVTNDKEPIKYLISKFMYTNDNDEIAALKSRLAELESVK